MPSREREDAVSDHDDSLPNRPSGSGEQPSHSPTVAVIGTLDTKGPAVSFAVERLRAAGVLTIVIDTGILGAPRAQADISAAEVARRGGTDLAELRRSRDRERAAATMTAGAAAIVTDLRDRGVVRGALCLAGRWGTQIGAAALQTLPIGIPKIMVSTLASADGATAAVMGIRDMTMLNPITSIGIETELSRRIIANAVGALAGIATGPGLPSGGDRTSRIAQTMFGVTTRCATRVRERLEASGFEVLTFAATGIGDQAMEDMVQQGFIDGVVDVTISQAGIGFLRGTAPGGSQRLEIAGALGIPQAVAPGGLDIIVCQAGDPLIAEAEQGRRLMHKHSPALTDVRPTAEESWRVGREIARRLSTARGPTAMVIPLRGFSEYSVPGGPLYDAECDMAFVAGFRKYVAPFVRLREIDAAINDREFADELTATFLELTRSQA